MPLNPSPSNAPLDLPPSCHFPFSHFHFLLSLTPFRPLPLRAPKSRRINTYEIPRKCCIQITYRIARSFKCNTFKKQGGGMANQKSVKEGGATVNSKDRNTAPSCGTCRNERQPNLEPADSSAPPVAGPALRPGYAPLLRGPYARRLPARERSHPQSPALSNPWA